MFSVVAVNDLSVVDVYKRFSSSESSFLRDIAEDVRQSFGLGIEDMQQSKIEDGVLYMPVSDIAAVIFRWNKIMKADGSFHWGSNAEIAECLFGDRLKAGGGYLVRIQKVKALMSEVYEIYSEVCLCQEVFEGDN